MNILKIKVSSTPWIACFLFALFATGCGDVKRPDGTTGPAPLRFEGESSATTSVALASFDLSQMNNVEVVARSGQGDLPVQVIESESFTITVEADGHTSGEVANYFQGSLRDTREHTLRLTLGDRYIGCSRSQSHGELLNVNGVCATRLIVGIPRSSSIEFYVGMETTDIFRHTHAPHLRRVTPGDNFTLTP